MRPGGWLDTLLFLGGSLAPFVAAAWWSTGDQRSSAAQGELGESVAIAVIAFLLGAAVYQTAQRSRAQSDVLYPRRGGALIAAFLGLAFPILLVAGSWALETVTAGLGPLVLLFSLPWVLSRAQWTATPPKSE